MPICLKCNERFPHTVKVDGIIHHISNRKYCLECSPFKMHNTKKIHIVRNLEDGSKFCNKCKTTKPFSEFYRRRQGDDLSPYCKPCTNDQARSRQLEQKRKAVEYKGNKCKICGYSKYIGSLEFHHIDPSKKKFTIAHVKSTTFKKIIPELDKCVLLCRNCHSEVHSGITSLP